MKKNILSTLFVASAFAFMYMPGMVMAQIWTVKTSMPTKRAAMAATAVGNDIFVFGGVESFGGTPSDTVEVYSTVTDSWKSCASMPTERAEMVAATVDGKVYVIGGFGSGGALNTVEIYDPETDTWETGAPMPTARAQISGSVIDGKIYITGGYSAEYTELEIYDPASDSWSAGTSIPMGVLQNNSGVNCNDKFYVIGGKNYAGSAFYNTNYEYDPATDEWLEKETMPEELFAGTAAVLNNKIHYFGGAHTNIPIPNFDYHYIYNPATDTWTAGLSMLEERANHVSVTVGTAVYVIGGYLTCTDCDYITGLNEKYSEGQTDLDNIAIERNFLVYPNPARGYVTIEAGEANNNLRQITLTDIMGKVLINRQFKGDRISFNTASVADGIYLLSIQGNGTTYSTKVIIKK